MTRRSSKPTRLWQGRPSVAVRRWARRSPMPGACMTCTGTSGSGVPIGARRITTPSHPSGTPRVPPRPSACSAVSRLPCFGEVHGSTGDPKSFVVRSAGYAVSRWALFRVTSPGTVSESRAAWGPRRHRLRKRRRAPRRMSQAPPVTCFASRTTFSGLCRSVSTR